MTPEGKYKKQFMERFKKSYPKAEFAHFKSANYPDLIVFLDGSTYLVEFKAAKGRLSPGQRRMLSVLERNNFYIEVLTEGTDYGWITSSDGRTVLSY